MADKYFGEEPVVGNGDRLQEFVDRHLTEGRGGVIPFLLQSQENDGERQRVAIRITEAQFRTAASLLVVDYPAALPGLLRYAPPDCIPPDLVKRAQPLAAFRWQR